MRILVGDPGKFEVTNGLTYDFNGQDMTIYWKRNPEDTLEYTQQVEKGDIVDILCRNNELIIEKWVLPKERNFLILWLLQIPEEYMATSQSSFEEKYASRRKVYSSRVTKDVVFSRHPYHAFAYYRCLGDDMLYPVAAYCTIISKRSLKKILEEVTREDPTLRIILKSETHKHILKYKLGFTDAEVNAF